MESWQWQARLQIEALIFSYAEAIDNGEIDRLGVLFERGAIRVDGQQGAVEGAQAVKQMFAKFTIFYNDKLEKVDPLHEAGKPFTRHITSNLYFKTMTPEQVETASCFTVIQALPGQAMQPIISGRYHDTFCCDKAATEEAGWYFQERYEYLDLFGDLSHHLNFDVT